MTIEQQISELDALIEQGQPEDMPDDVWLTLHRQRRWLEIERAKGVGHGN